MIRFLFRRILWGVAIVWFVATLVFGLFFVAPRDVARLIAGRQASDKTIQLVRERLGLDQPVPVQYVRFLGRLVRGDRLDRALLDNVGNVAVAVRGFR